MKQLYRRQATVVTSNVSIHGKYCQGIICPRREATSASGRITAETSWVKLKLTSFMISYIKCYYNLVYFINVSR